MVYYFLIKSEKVISILLRALKVAKYRPTYELDEVCSWFNIFSVAQITAYGS